MRDDVCACVCVTGHKGDRLPFVFIFASGLASACVSEMGECVHKHKCSLIEPRIKTLHSISYSVTESVSISILVKKYCKLMLLLKQWALLG